MDIQVEKKIEAYIKAAMQKGADNDTIILKLKNAGISEIVAESLIKKVELMPFFEYDESTYNEKKQKLLSAREKYGGKNKIKIEELMSSPVVTVKKNEYVINSARAMYEKNISSVVVIDPDEEDKPIGIVTSQSLTKLIAENIDYRSMRVEQIMDYNLIMADADDSLSKIGTLMRVNNVKRVIIMKDAKLVGIITSTELIKLMALI
ncbi:MAG: CBS domain-containing protein [Candidatus Woesearchaeota archaeon]